MIGLLKVKDYQGALKVVDDTIADPSLDRNRTTRGLAQIASTIARIVGDFDRARRYCELRVACDPEDAMALYVLADCLDHQGEADQAMKIARKSYELSLARRGAQGEGLVELIETRFPRVTLGA
ncbi:MAG TPA: hypothetical protein VK763_02180 [Terriglobales bacterium]|nr:hypothetical protein [Terriglobales bacterium]